MFDFVPSTVLDSFLMAWRYIYLFMPAWLPVLFITLGFQAWVNYKRAYYWNVKLGSVVLELKLPKDIYKSPLAMELVLNQMHQTADEGNWYWKYQKGQTRSWFSLEIASFGGDIHFYVWLRKKYRVGMEAHLYSQYPGIEINEIEDYTIPFSFDPNRQKMTAVQWKLDEPDPLPISTYVDYKLDKDPKEEFKVDPLTSQLEFLGSLPKGHNCWIQIIVQAHHKRDHPRFLSPSKWFEKGFSEKYDPWKEEALEMIKKIREEATTKYVDEKGVEHSGFPNPTKGQTEKIAALERSINKLGFDVGLRSMYFADKDIYDNIYVGGMLGSFKQYSTLGYNGFGINGWHMAYSNPWKDKLWKGNPERLGAMVMEEYKLRRFFYSPYRGRFFYAKSFVLNTEELATIYHLPGEIAATPTLGRVPSKKSEAPPNLPV